MRAKNTGLAAVMLMSTFAGQGQSNSRPFPIRTITAGVTLQSLRDTATLLNAISFLQEAKKVYVANGYIVQTLRIATNNFTNYAGDGPYEKTIPSLIIMDSIARRHHIIISIGQIIQGDAYPAGIDQWVVALIQNTANISFSVPISSHTQGIHKNSIKAAAAIIEAISKNSEGGEGNFRFTASANCPPGIPFFPAAFHEGPNSFAIGLESPGLITEVFSHGDKENARQHLIAAFEKVLLPVQQIAERISDARNDVTANDATANDAKTDLPPAGVGRKWKYDGIDDSPAPGLNSSIAEAIEAYTGQPFGSPSTLSACALITDVLKGLAIKKCGYSGLMLPVIEDKILAKRADEGRYTVQELLLFSSVSGTGLDVVPLPGNTPVAKIEDILTDIAALSLKYTAKALSGRLFLIPGKVAGDVIEFKNPNLTRSKVMKIE
jgi:uncharacterized protein